MGPVADDGYDMPDAALLRVVSGVNYATPTPREADPDYNYHDKLERGAPGTSTGSATGTRAARGLGVEAAYKQPAPAPSAE